MSRPHNPYLDGVDAALRKVGALLEDTSASLAVWCATVHRARLEARRDALREAYEAVSAMTQPLDNAPSIK